jgi:glutamate-ammonia-ligase adenylyltransferase
MTSDSEMALKKRLENLPDDPELLAEGQKWLTQLQEKLAEAELPAMDSAQAEQLMRAFCCSRFVVKALLVNPDWVTQICTESQLLQPFGKERFADFDDLLGGAPDDDSFMRQLRVLRQREMMRIALRDLFGWADLTETMDALSQLAEFCVEQAHFRAYQQQCARFGRPESEEGEEQSLVVLAMGKLGGGELNYSSDIDLVFAYPEPGKTKPETENQRSTDNQRFFIGQAQLIIRYINEITADGFVFRIDARLRPFGESGALVVSFGFMESYYQYQGRDWERYAMIKARPICGLADHRLQLEKLLQPFVYRRYLDYGAFNALRDMKALIMREVERKGMQDNIKLGSGGIREIEFTGQAFQLIHGGRDPELRCRQILTVLLRLARRGVLDQNMVSALQEAYCFLRDTENRLQMVDDRQVHDLPQDQLERQRLAYSLGYRDWFAFKTALDQHRSAVCDYFAGLFFTNKESGVDEPDQNRLAMQQMIDGRLSESDAVAVLSDSGFDNAEAVYSQLSRFLASSVYKHITPLAQERLSALLPVVLQHLASVDNPEQTTNRVLDLLQAVVQRPVYLALLIEYPVALIQMIKLFEASGWIADYLVRHPILLDSLLDTELL